MWVFFWQTRIFFRQNFIQCESNKTILNDYWRFCRLLRAGFVSLIFGQWYKKVPTNFNFLFKMIYWHFWRFINNSLTTNFFPKQYMKILLLDCKKLQSKRCKSSLISSVSQFAAGSSKYQPESLLRSKPTACAFCHRKWLNRSKQSLLGQKYWHFALFLIIKKV